MYKLDKNPILLPHQKTILKLFFSYPENKTFFLTGGTALSAFYFAHRDSKDFDFFTIESYDQKRTKNIIEGIGKETGAILSTKIQSLTYQELYLENRKDGWIQRIDIVHEQPRHFGEIRSIDTIRVDSLENIGSNKITAIYGRLEVKDYIDLYMILKRTNLTFDALFKLAKEKDTGLFEFYFANIITSVEKIESLPLMKMPFRKEDLVEFYENLSRELLMRIKPKE